MKDISTLENFLSSLALVSEIDCQIWDLNKEMTFSTAHADSKALPFKALCNLSSNILNHGTYQYAAHDEISYLCGIPLKNEQGIFGALTAIGSVTGNTLESHKEPNTKNSRAEKMKSFLGHISTIVEKNLTAQEEIKEMAYELDQSFEDLYLYSKIATQIKTLRFSGTMLINLIEKLVKTMRVEMAFAMFPNCPQYDVHTINKDSFRDIPDQKRFIKSLISRIPKDAQSLSEGFSIVNNSMENLHYRDLAKDPYRFLAVRIHNQKVSYGWLGLVSFNLKEIFRQSELKLLTSMAEQLAVVISNTNLYEDLEKFIINMVKSFIFALEAKDKYTRGHSERVSNYSRRIGRRLGLNKKDQTDLKWASILHDIGKIGIPESILNKTGRLTDDEFGIIKEHPQKGGDILKPVSQLADSMSGIIHHHERYDGGGYPGRLKGEEIPLIGRIIAVADTFDAISSNRAYRDAKSPEKALEIVKDVSGSQLDPRIVKVFEEVYEKDLRDRSEKGHAN